MATAVLTPFDLGAGAQNGGTWWKRLLPVGDIEYQGRTLHFTRDYLAGLVESFRRRAYDQVPFQLAGDDNKHTNDVERTGGEITGMELRGDGLWIGVAPNARGAQVLTANPKVGVSARIVESYERSDGQLFPKAIQHVLATLDPRIPELGPWQAVEAANDVDTTFDLSGLTFATDEPEATTMPEMTDDQRRKLTRLLEIPDDQLDALVAGLDNPAAAAAGAAELDPTPGDDALLSDAELDALVSEAERMDAAGLLDEDGEPVGALAGAGAGLSNEALMAIELAQATGDENARQLGIINSQLDSERWQNERRKLTAAGVPPYIADLAQPLLEGSGHVVDLANGQAVDAGAIMRKVLSEYARIGEQLGVGIELGSPFDEPDGEATAARERDGVVALARTQMGL
jgi:hypothetical protein